METKKKKFSVFNFLKQEHQQQKPHDEESNKLLKSEHPEKRQIQSNIPYNPKLYPPNILQCEEHAKARRASFPQSIINRAMGKTLEEQAINVCDCCGYPAENQLIPLCSSSKELVFLGSGFPLFFNFIKYSIGLLFMILMIAGCYNLITNIESADCNDSLEILGKKCTADYFTQTSLLNKANSHQFLNSQEILNLISVLFTMVFLHILRFKQRKLAFQCDLHIITASDYTLQISNLPPQLNEKKLIEFLENLPIKTKEKIKVAKINQSYYIHEFMKWVQEQVDLSNKLLFLQSIKEDIRSHISIEKDEESRKESEQHLQNLYKIEEKDKQRLKEIEKNIEYERKNFKNSCVFTGIAFVTFETPFQAQIVKAFFKLGFLDKMKLYFDQRFNKESKFLFENQAIVVMRAPEPNDVLWENLGFSQSFRLKKTILTWALTFFSLVMSFMAISAIYYFQIYMNEKEKITGAVKYIVSYSGCFCIILINNVLIIIVTSLSTKEKQQNYTDYDISLTQKKTASLFLNSACIYLLVAFWSNNFFGTNGLISNILTVFVSNMVMQPLLYLLSPSHLYKIYKQRKMKKNPKAYQITQLEANKIFEGDVFEITVCYSSVLNVMLFAAFYAPLLPLALIFAIITLTIFYWIFKYILLRRCCTPSFLGKEIGYEAIEIMEFVPLFLAVGDIFFNLIFYGSTGFVTYVTLTLSIFNFIFPMGWLNKQLMPFEEKKKSRLESPDNYLEYFQARIDFNEDYDRSNPMTQEKAKNEWIEFAEKRGEVVSVPEQREEKAKKSGGNFNEEQNEINLDKRDDFEMLTNYAATSKRQTKKGRNISIAKRY